MSEFKGKAENIRCGLAQAGDNGSSSEHCQALLMMLA
jgi:hypothetical protein